MDFVIYECRNRIGYITLNRPDKLNALTDEGVLEVRAALVRLNDDHDALVGIISGAGTSFCAGADVRQRQMRSPEELVVLGGPQGRGAHIEDLMFRLAQNKPIIAAVHGYVLGAGLHIALLCDYLVADEDAKFQITEVVRGVDASAFWALLTQRGAGGFANDVAITGRFWGAAEAAHHGVVNRLASPGTHLAVAEEVAEQIARNAPLAVRAIVETRRKALESVEVEANAVDRRLYLTEDFRESARAFSERRPPVFRAR